MNNHNHELERCLARRLREAGIPLDQNLEGGIGCANGGGFLVRQVSDHLVNTAFDGDLGGTGYTLDLVIVSNFPGTAAVFDIDLELPWSDQRLIWLQDPAERGCKGNPYVFPGRNSLEWPRDMVMNHHIFSHRNLRRGDFIEGLLLGFSFDSVPSQYVHGQVVEAKLALFDQRGHSYSSPISLWLDRTAKLQPRRPSKARVSRLRLGSTAEETFGSAAVGPASPKNSFGSWAESDDLAAEVV